jgi:hypothetical protein
VEDRRNWEMRKELDRGTPDPGVTRPHLEGRLLNLLSVEQACRWSNLRYYLMEGPANCTRVPLVRIFTPLNYLLTPPFRHTPGLLARPLSWISRRCAGYWPDEDRRYYWPTYGCGQLDSISLTGYLSLGARLHRSGSWRVLQHAPSTVSTHTTCPLWIGNRRSTPNWA